MRFLCLASLSIGLFSFCHITQAAEIHPIKIPGLISTANQLNNTGTVEMQSPTKHFIYLKITNDHIDRLYPILRNDLPFIMRRCLHKDVNVIGAHITLFEPESITPALWMKIQPLLGKSFTFTPENSSLLFINKVRQNKHINQIWFVMSVNAPELYKALKQIDPNNPHFNQLHYSIAISAEVNGQCDAHT